MDQGRDIYKCCARQLAKYNKAMYSEEYSILFYKRSDYRPEEKVIEWNSLVKSIEDGYNYVEPELDNDLYLRDEIDSLLADRELQQFEDDHRHFLGEIEAIDARLKQLVFDNPFYNHVTNKKWWQQIILKKGRSNYYNDVFKIYNIKIELVN